MLKKKTTLVTIILAIMPFLNFGQGAFSRGFEEGFKQSYCYNDRMGCVPPAAPATPSTTAYESINSYNDGYNRGFQTGLTAKEKGIRGGFKATKTEFVDEAMFVRYKNLDMNKIRKVVRALKTLKGKALTALNNENYYGALKLAKLGLKINPKDDEFPLVLGQAYLGLGQEMKSIKWYKKAQKKVYRKPIAKRIKRIRQNYYQKKETNQTKNKKKTRNFETIEVTFKDRTPFKQRLYILPTVASRIIYECPKNAKVLLTQIANKYFYKARVNGYEGYITKSFLDLNNKVNKTNTENDYRNNDINTLFREKKFKQVIKTIDNKTKNKEVSKMYGRRGIANYELKNYNETIKDITRMAKYDEGIPARYLFYRALAKSEIGDYYGSTDDLNIWLDKKGTKIQSKATVYNNIAYNYVNLKKYRKALPLVNQALRYDKNKYYIWDTRAEIYLYTNQIEEAIKDASKAIEIKPDSNSYYTRGLALIKKGKLEEGCVDLSKAGQLGKKVSYKKIEKYCN